MVFIAIFVCLISGVFSAEIVCKFELYDGQYFCRTNEGPFVSITDENEPISFTGTHVATKNDDDVSNFFMSHPHQLSFLPTQIFKTFKNLQTFELQTVGLKILKTNAFTDCLKLDTLKLQSNTFSSVPSSFAESCVNVKYLTIAGNSIQSVDKDAFKGLINLLLLDMLAQSVESLDPSTFDHTPNLKYILLRNGKLKTLHPEMFASLSLASLHLNSNEIEVVPALKFKNILDFWEIDLSNNKINSIDPEMLNSFPANHDAFVYGFENNLCVNGTFMKQDQLIALQSCFNNWINSPSPATTTSIPPATTTTPVEITSKPLTNKRCKYV